MTTTRFAGVFLAVAAATALTGTPLAAATVAEPGSPAARPAVRTGAQAAPRFAVPFLHDDYTRALAQARARKVPLFIEAWAPW